jgi:hypothetical protein
MFEWFQKELLDSKNKGEKVIIMGHISPSKDERWIGQKLRLITRLFELYKDTILGFFSGHNHEDRFKVYLNNENKPITSIFIGGKHNH